LNTRLPLVLAIDTATSEGGVCIARGTDLLAVIDSMPGVSHSESLLLDIERALSAAGVVRSDLDLLAVAIGPGSFTGLRIGLATIKALALTLQRPCCGVPTLHALAHSAGPSPATVAALPAGRGELFAQLFSVNDDRAVTARDQPAHLAPANLMERYGNISDLLWTGAGAAAQRGLIESHAVAHGFGFSENSATPDGWRLARGASNLGPSVTALALQQNQEGQVSQAESLHAIYVRPSDAELTCRP